MKENSRLVYSTETGRVCPKCGKPSDRCGCGKKRPEPGRHPADRGDGVVRILLERKGRKGKTVTAVAGIDLEGPDLAALAKALKGRCGAGGSVKDGAVLIQGDHRETLETELRSRGYTVKRSGG